MHITNAWVDNLDSDPKANLDVVGTAFISGTTIDFLQHTQFADRTKTAVDNAFLVGGDSSFPNDISVFRIATTNGGRVGINVDNSQLDRASVVNGLSRFTDDAKFEHDIEVNGDDGALAEVRTSQTTGQVNLFNDSTFVGGDNTAGLHIGGYAKTIRMVITTLVLLNGFTLVISLLEISLFILVILLIMLISSLVIFLKMHKYLRQRLVVHTIVLNSYCSLTLKLRELSLQVM